MILFGFVCDYIGMVRTIGWYGVVWCGVVYAVLCGVIYCDTV